MTLPRRFLPSMSSLLALEAVGRLGSATAAAAELNLTHSAVSRQLRVLEGQLGVTLLARDGVRLCLTPQAEEYCATVRGTLRELSQASLRLTANPHGGSLNLAVLPAFGMHWLAPKLPGFAAEHPEITVNLTSRLAPFDFAAEALDAAIHFGNRDWPGVDYLPLASERVRAVCAPGLIAAPLRTPDELMALPLLHLETRPDAWERWFAAQGRPATGLAGMLFDQFSTMTQAAVHGMGVALLPSYVAGPEIALGRLVPAFGDSVPMAGAYFLVWPTRQPRRSPLVRFAAWLEARHAPAGLRDAGTVG